MTKKELYNLRHGDPLFHWFEGFVFKFEGWVIGGAGIYDDASSCLAVYGRRANIFIAETHKLSRENALLYYEVSAEKALLKLNKWALDGYKKDLQELIKANQ